MIYISTEYGDNTDFSIFQVEFSYFSGITL